jgi:Icc protein
MTRRKALALVLVMLAALWLPLAGSASAAPAVNFCFVQITDTHFGETPTAKIEKVVDLINALPMKIEFVVHTGDIIMERIEKPEVLEQALTVMKKLKPPVYYLAGNHDFGGGSVRSTVELYKKSFGPLAQKVECQGVVFLLVCTEPLSESIHIEGYDPLAWLEEQLKAAGDRPVIVCNHNPPVKEFLGGRYESRWKPEAAGKCEQLLNAHHVLAEISGHFHRDELHWLGRVPVYVAPPVAMNWGRQPSFRIYEYADGKLGYRTQYLEK